MHENISEAHGGKENSVATVLIKVLPNLIPHVFDEEDSRGDNFANKASVQSPETFEGNPRLQLSHIKNIIKLRGGKKGGGERRDNYG